MWFYTCPFALSCICFTSFQHVVLQFLEIFLPSKSFSLESWFPNNCTELHHMLPRWSFTEDILALCWLQACGGRMAQTTRTPPRSSIHQVPRGRRQPVGFPPTRQNSASSQRHTSGFRSIHEDAQNRAMHRPSQSRRHRRVDKMPPAKARAQTVLSHPPKRGEDCQDFLHQNEATEKAREAAKAA